MLILPIDRFANGSTNKSFPPPQNCLGLAAEQARSLRKGYQAVAIRFRHQAVSYLLFVVSILAIQRRGKDRCVRALIK